MLKMLNVKCCFLIIFSYLLLGNAAVYGNSGWSGYVEGVFNGLGAETYRESGSQLEKEVEGNKYWAISQIKYEKKSKTYDVNLDTKFKITDLAYLEYTVKELNIKNRYRNWDLSYGRLYVNWSDMDKNWGLGKVNNREGFDYFDPGQEGLVGALASSKNKKGFIWEVFASPLYVPESNPGQDINNTDKTITPKSAWTTKTAETVTISGIEKPILYDVDMPSIDEIVFNYSAGVKLGYQNEKMRITGFALRKPENNITLGAGVNLDTSQNTVVASIEPRVFYHNLFGGEFNYKLKEGLVLRASALMVQPENEPEEAYRFFSSVTNIKAGKRQENYLGASIINYGKNYRLALRYIARVSDFDRTDDILAENPRWSQAINLFAQLRLGKSFRLTFDGKYDTLAGDRLIDFDLSYKVNEHFLVRGGVRLIGVDETEISFWTPFANNDAVYIAGRYIF